MNLRRFYEVHYTTYALAIFFDVFMNIVSKYLFQILKAVENLI